MAGEDKNSTTENITADNINGVSRKAPPHLRRLNYRLSSPSDNLSPFSQKLMAADRVKGVKPRPFNSLLAQIPNADSDDCSQESTTGKLLLDEIDDGKTRLCNNITEDLSDDQEEGQECDEDEDELQTPPSPTRHTGGLARL